MKIREAVFFGFGLTVFLLMASRGFAHVGDGVPHVHGSSFLSGLGHPFLGLDHLAAMVAVGLWAALMGGRMMVALPAAFVGAMVVGGAIAFAGVGLPFVEPAIAASLLVFGLILVAAVRLPMAAGMGLAAAFALFHGHAHGAEMGAGLGAGLYSLGFALATLALHLVGLGLGVALRRIPAPAGRPELAFRLGGVAVLVAGLVVVL